MTTLKTTPKTTNKRKTKRKTKRDTLKPPRTVTITKRFLNSLHACNGGIRDVAPLLPAVLSTDPDANIDLAIALVNLDVSYRVEWLLNEVDCETDCNCSSCLGVFYELSVRHQPLVIQQMLAMIADAILSKRGL